ncbi:hypothetical protein [Halalkalibacter okhensis]|uniref:Uncharacterized protein n=1 Tax=Halalkalibacter okhensis TaxID=333138 RepID=A0A0B0IDM9_9BACI|nr:hypothetical protein [Halalkalibacter okhensis]KHF40708.1 hypothetical protein LQ50_07905 [Halalkalibacter okhensis]
MFKIETPNKNYNGSTYGVAFVNGQGETNKEEIKNILVHDFGYKLVKEVTDKPKSPTKKTASK